MRSARRIRWSRPAVGIALIVALCAALDDSFARAREEVLSARFADGRRDTLLAWDDGDNSNFPVVTGGEAGVKVAVKFIGPAWADYVKEIHYRIDTNSGTQPFIAWVWRPEAGGRPGDPGNAGQQVPGGYAGDAWLELALTDAIYLGDEVEYPGRTFFVGLEILHDYNPQISADVDAPVDQMSYRWDLSNWELLAAADAMIRVVVSVIPTATATSTWTAIKALYR